MAVTTPVCDFDAPFVDFTVPDPRGHIWPASDIRGKRGTLVIFMCNHCPYVRSILPRIVRDAAELQDRYGIGVVGISSNDINRYPEDSPKLMGRLASAHKFTFPYLYDEHQAVARAFGAECTPDFFGYNADDRLQYRGRLDASGRIAAPETARRELFDAMVMIANTGVGPKDQIPSMGCSIKWKPDS